MARGVFMTETFALTHLPSGQTIAQVGRVGGWWAQGRGVIGMRALPAGEGIWLPGVASVHTLFVRFPLDLLFLDRDFRLVRAQVAFPPWRPLAWAPGAHHTIELGAGTLAIGTMLRPGEHWELRRLT